MDNASHTHSLRKNIEAKRRKKAEKLKIVSARLTQQ